MNSVQAFSLYFGLAELNLSLQLKPTEKNNKIMRGNRKKCPNLVVSKQLVQWGFQASFRRTFSQNCDKIKFYLQF